MFWTLIYLKQSSAQCSTLEYIMHGYCKGIVGGLIGGANTSTVGLATLVGIIGTIAFFIFLL
jgi:predicted lipid-binding transport protein (Tim44 family)